MTAGRQSDLYHDGQSHLMVVAEQHHGQLTHCVVIPDPWRYHLLCACATIVRRRHARHNESVLDSADRAESLEDVARRTHHKPRVAERFTIWTLRVYRRVYIVPVFVTVVGSRSGIRKFFCATARKGFRSGRGQSLQQQPEAVGRSSCSRRLLQLEHIISIKPAGNKGNFTGLTLPHAPRHEQ